MAMGGLQSEGCLVNRNTAAASDFDPEKKGLRKCNDDGHDDGGFKAGNYGDEDVDIRGDASQITRLFIITRDV